MGLACLLWLLGGCALPSSGDRQALAWRLAAAAGWSALRVQADGFDMQAFVSPAFRDGGRDDTLTLYLEGDGLVTAAPYRLSLDPTPVDPVALRLALADGGRRVAWLGRPCQYPGHGPSTRCRQALWSSHRYAPDVVAAVGSAIDQIKAMSGADRLRLIGYSGGAAMAALVAAQRQDVVAWASVAGTLDTDAWVRALDLSPLRGSLNLGSMAPRLRHLPQRHLVGEDDAVMPLAVPLAFLQAMDGGVQVAPDDVRLVRQPGFDHVCCWVRDWPRLRGQLP
ncbi:MAG: alpha/beta hydrolase [Burkholderiaceae bacterium]